MLTETSSAAAAVVRSNAVHTFKAFSTWANAATALVDVELAQSSTVSSASAVANVGSNAFAMGTRGVTNSLLAERALVADCCGA
jgi:hypothetical protein